MVSLKRSRLIDRFKCVFFNTECTKDTENINGSFELISNLIYVHQMCSICESLNDLRIDCEQWRKLTHIFWKNIVCLFVKYLRLSRPFSDNVYVISHTSRGYDAELLMRRFLELKWLPKLISDGTKASTMSVEKLNFQDSLYYLPMRIK